MSKSLVIVESPAKAKTITKFLGPGYVVKASFGHVRDLPQSAAEIPEKVKKEKWARLGVNVDSGFEPIYVVPGDKKKHITELKKHLKGADKILLATDEDREGESISWHLIEVLKPKVPVERIVFHEITKEAIINAVENPRQLDERLVKAQESRRILDRLYGYTLSPILWKKVKPKLSAGRVQSVAVRLLVMRERERRAFRSANYWDLSAECKSQEGKDFPATMTALDGRRLVSGKDFDETTGSLKKLDAVLLSEDDANELRKELLEEGKFKIKAVESTPYSKKPAPPFSTSTLQQEANRKLGFTAKRTMRTAQGLYEGIDLGEGERTGLITYMRTDSYNLAEKALTDAASVIKEMYGAAFTKGPRHYKAKGRAQEAHEAIRPTDLNRTPKDLDKFLDEDQMKLYELIWKRTIASQMVDAELMRTAVTLNADSSKGEATFMARGQRIVAPGFLRAYVEGSDDPDADLMDKDVVLPDLRAGESADINSMEVLRHETKPPARYTEASLVKRLEEEGVGRPSTYASIIGTIQVRGYSYKAGSALVPTFVAFAVTELLEKHFGDLVDIGFTAALEDQLDDIAEGKLDGISHLEAFYRGTASSPGLTMKIEREEEKIEYPALEIGSGEDNQPIVVRVGRYGPFLQKGDPEKAERASIPEGIAPADLSIEMAEQLIKDSKAGGRLLGKDPETGLEITMRTGRFGPYVQLGPDVSKEDKEAGVSPPKRASLKQGMQPSEVTLDDALGLLIFPRVLQGATKDQAEISVAIGRFGPYVKQDKEYRSIPDDEDPETINLERALKLLSEPKKSRRTITKTVLKDLGKDEKSGKDIQVLNGRYGPYVSDGETNATLPRTAKPEDVTMDQALQLIAERAAKGPAKKRKPAKRKSAKKKK